MLNIILEDGPKFIPFFGLTIDVKFTSGLSSRNRICVVVVRFTQVKFLASPETVVLGSVNVVIISYARMGPFWNLNCVGSHVKRVENGLASVEFKY